VNWADAAAGLDTDQTPRKYPQNQLGEPVHTDSSSDSASHTHSARRPALVRALCPVALRAGLLRAAWRTALCAWRWRKAGSFLPHSSFVFSRRKLQKLCVGRWGPVSLWLCVLSSALIGNALAWRCSRRRDKLLTNHAFSLPAKCINVLDITPWPVISWPQAALDARRVPPPGCPDCVREGLTQEGLTRVG